MIDIEKKRFQFGIELDDAIWYKRRTKRSIAEEVGITPESLTHYTNGGRMPPVDKFMMICNALKLTDEEIMKCINVFREA